MIVKRAPLICARGLAAAARPRALLFVGLLCSCRGCSREETSPAVTADAAPPSSPSTSNEAAASAASLQTVEAFRLRARVPAIAWATVTRDREQSGATGFADIEAQSPALSSTPFEAASIAKTIIATCVMQLVEDKRLSLDADVSLYVGFPLRSTNSHTPITLRHLLTHTSSIVDTPAAATETATSTAKNNLGDFLSRYFADAGSSGGGGGAVGPFLDTGPGRAMVYSNVGPSLAALAVERATRSTSFAEYARARVFVPLGMTTTHFHRSAEAAVGYAASTATDGGFAFTRLPSSAHAIYPVVDLFASAHELARFARAILRGGELDGARILSATSVAEMLRIQLDAAPEEALGWQRRTFAGPNNAAAHVVFGHEGEDRGASTGLYLDPIANVGVVVLANGDAFQSGDETRANAISDLISKLLDDAH